MRYDINGNVVTSSDGFGSSELSTVFDVKPVRLIEKPFEGSTVLSFLGDGIYSANPWMSGGSLQTNNRRYIQITFLNANKEKITLTATDGTTVTSLKNLTTYFYAVKGNEVTIHWVLAFEDYESGEWHTGLTYTFAETPSYIQCSVSREDVNDYFGMAYNFMSDSEMIEWDARTVTVDEDKTIGLFEQMNDFVQNENNNNILDSKELGKIIKSTIVKEMNKTRDALRIATYNIYGANMMQKNWNVVKDQLKDFGIDLCAFQEVKSPLGTMSGMPKVFADEMKSWQFPYCSSNGDLHEVNERMLTSAFPITSTHEWEFAKWSSDRRCCAKYEVQLPLYKDRVGSDQLKMSIYNTQLEVYPTNTGNATNRISETQEILDMIAEDKNPFIVVCMDSNDFSPDKEIWKMFTDAGFTYAIPIKTQTVTAQDNCIDQIFVNANMEVLNYDVIHSNLYQYKSDGVSSPVSDHDLCFADIRLDYDNFYCIKQKLTNVTSDCSEVIIDNDSALTIRLSANSGYTLGTVKVRMGADDVTASVYANGVITIPSVTGDLYITATAS